VDGIGFSTTLGWSINTISHMALEELFKQIIGGSMMDNSKMENSMDIFELLIKMVDLRNQNIKMVRR
jgi:hypothetical protein